MNIQDHTPDYPMAAAAHLGMPSAKQMKPPLAVDETAKLLTEAIGRTRAARRRICEAADVLFGELPEQPTSATAGMVGCSIALTTLIRDLHEEICSLEHQVARL